MKRAREDACRTDSAGQSMHSRSFVGVYRTKSGEHWRAWIGFAGKHHTVGGRWAG